MPLRSVFCLLVAAAGLFALAPAASADLAGEVNPFIGTAPGNAPVGFKVKSGDVFPGAVCPQGMLQWSPDTPSDLPGGYSYPDRAIKGFSVRHFSGRGCNAWQDLAFMPCVGGIAAPPSRANGFYASSFSHGREEAAPGDYRVRLDNGVRVELTATARTGLARFTFPPVPEATLLINAGSTITGATADTAVAIVGPDRVEGKITARVGCGKELYTLYFSAEFDRPFLGFATWSGGAIARGSRAAAGGKSGAILTFDASVQTAVQAKVGLSFVSIGNAEANLRAEDPAWDFTAVRAAARAAWNRVLGRIVIGGGAAADRQTFYTALYHAFFHPNLFNDANGQYRGMDGELYALAAGHAHYENITAWDSYRSEVPLLALLAPKETSDLMQSLVDDAEQGGGGLPRWVQANRNSGGMVGDGPVIMLASAYAFGATQFDTSGALAAMGANAGKNGTLSDGHLVREGLADYLSLGFVPGSASKTLEYASADFALSQFAQALGEESEAAVYLARSGNWSRLYNPSTGWIQPKDRDGSWMPEVTPATLRGYTEGTAAQYTWMVPFDLAGLFARMGGKARAVARLDDYFTKLNDGWESPYAFMGNEPGEGDPWEYDYAGAPEKTQDVVRRIQTDLFNATPAGLPGNDDAGALSSWYVFSALGLYPEVPGVGGFVIGSPLFPSATLMLEKGRRIEIQGLHASTLNRYVQSLQIDGAPATNLWLPFAGLRNGKTLNFTLSDRPSAWGTGPADAPPSFGPEKANP